MAGTTSAPGVDGAVFAAMTARPLAEHIVGDHDAGRVGVRLGRPVPECDAVRAGWADREEVVVDGDVVDVAEIGLEREVSGASAAQWADLDVAPDGGVPHEHTAGLGEAVRRPRRRVLVTVAEIPRVVAVRVGDLAIAEQFTTVGVPVSSDRVTVMFGPTMVAPTQSPPWTSLSCTTTAPGLSTSMVALTIEFFSVKVPDWIRNP